MVPHRFRILGLVLFAVAEIALILIASFDIIDADAAFKIGGTLVGLGIALGLTDAGIVEARRRDPDISALKDDVLADTTVRVSATDAAGAMRPREPISSEDINTPGPFRVPPGVKEDSR